MNRTETRTVLLARPGEARAQLQAALQQLGLDLLLVADPLETEQAQVLSLRPNNLVMVMDAEVEEVLERFDDLLALDDCRILFEEAELVATRAGWDVARWSRHLSAKLLGHGDVLPAGHEVDEPVARRPLQAVSGNDLLKREADMPTTVAPAEQLTAQFQVEEAPPIEQSFPREKAVVVAESPVIEEALSPIEAGLIVDEVVDVKPQQVEVALPETEPVKPQALASDYNDYDDLDAFSFLDERAIESAMARDAEVEAIRKAEAEAETALRAEALAEVNFELETPALAASAADDELIAQDTDPQAKPDSDAVLLDDYDALDSLSFLVESSLEETKAEDIEAGAALTEGVADMASVEAETTLDSVDFDSWQMPAELQAISPIVEQSNDTKSAKSVADEAGAALESTLEDWDFSSLDMTIPEPAAIDAPVTPESATSATDWSVYQDFEAISDLPNVAQIDNFDSGYREALAPIEPSELAPEEAYQRVEEDLKQFDAPPVKDEWQDFERPTLTLDVQQDETPSATSPKAAKPDAAKGRVEQLFETVSQWSLSEISLTIDEGGKRPAFEVKKDEADHANPEPELKFSSPSIAAISGVPKSKPEQPAALVSSEEQEGAVLLLGGIGGPDPLRQVLQNLPPGLPVPVLVQQWLDGGHYDRLQRQMERVCKMQVVLAQPEMSAEHGKVYIVSPGVRLAANSSSQLRFVSADTRDFANLLEALPGSSSVAVLLSGASDAFVEPLLRFQQSGGKLLAQSEEGCYDHTMPALMASRGAQLDTPAGIAARIKALWSTTELK